jgi:hypothetical protein
MGHARQERVKLVGTRSADYIRASGHCGCIAMGQAATRKQAVYMAAPERFAKKSDLLLQRGHRPYMAQSVGSVRRSRTSEVGGEADMPTSLKRRD